MVVSLVNFTLKKSPGKCILVNGTWHTPFEVESLGAKRWRQSLLHNGKPLGDYHLVVPSTQPSKPSVSKDSSNLSCQHECSLSPRRCHSQGDLSKLVVDDVSLSVGNLDFTPLSESQTSCNAASNVTDCPFLVDTVLSFIKAFRLKADNATLSRVVCEHFSSEAVEKAKKILWNTCKCNLESAGLSFHS